MTIIIQILLIATAAICKALVDTIIFHHGGRLPKVSFFDNNVQGRFLPFTKYPFDAKHIGNSLMIICFIIAAVIGRWMLVHWIIQVIVLGIIFILIFNLFWNKIFN